MCIRKRIEYPQIIIEYFSEYYLRTTYVRTSSSPLFHAPQNTVLTEHPPKPRLQGHYHMLSIGARVTADQEWEGAQDKLGCEKLS